MTPRSRYNFWIDDEQREGLRHVKDRDGVLESEQIRRAINQWLEAKGVKVKTAKRANASQGADTMTSVVYVFKRTDRP
jgi:hypothetical protein